MKPTVKLPQLSTTKATLWALSLGLSLGLIGGQVLHCQAQSSSKVDTAQGNSETQLRVHTGTTNSSQDSSNVDSKVKKLRTSASSLSFPSSMFDPWWTTTYHDPDASWMLRNLDVMPSDFDRNWVFTLGTHAYIPRLDTTDRGNEMTITAEVPGIEDKDLDVTVNDDSVTIKGEKKDETAQSKNDKAFHSIERSYGTFERTISLPCKVQSANAQATLKNGVLTITVPKSQLAQNDGRKLTIRTE